MGRSSNFTLFVDSRTKERFWAYEGAGVSMVDLSTVFTLVDLLLERGIECIPFLPFC